MKSRKTKPGPGMEGIFIPASVFLLAGFSWLLFGQVGIIIMMFLIFGGFSAVSMYFYLMTSNVSYFAAFLFQILMAIYAATLPVSIFPFHNVHVARFFYLCGLSIGVWLLYLAITKKARWKGREVYELAAANVGLSTHGFTERPRPVGRVECTPSELMGFADYLKRNLVAITYSDNSTLFFVPVRMGQEYGALLKLSGHYFQKTWVSFDKEGNVTVKISKKDYYLYVDELEFDQLCQTMGNLFIEFFEDYKRGEEERIINRLDSVGMNMFS